MEGQWPNAIGSISSIRTQKSAELKTLIRQRYCDFPALLVLLFTVIVVVVVAAVFVCQHNAALRRRTARGRPFSKKREQGAGTVSVSSWTRGPPLIKATRGCPLISSLVVYVLTITVTIIDIRSI